MLSGAKMRRPRIAEACCRTETLVGWIVLGTSAREPGGLARKPPVEQVIGDCCDDAQAGPHRRPR